MSLKLLKKQPINNLQTWRLIVEAQGLFLLTWVPRRTLLTRQSQFPIPNKDLSVKFKSRIKRDLNKQFWGLLKRNIPQ